MEKLNKKLGAGLLALSPVLSMAVTDTSAVAAAGATALEYAAAVAAVLISIWAAKLAYRKFFGG